MDSDQPQQQPDLWPRQQYDVWLQQQQQQRQEQQRRWYQQQQAQPVWHNQQIVQAWSPESRGPSGYPQSGPSNFHLGNYLPYAPRDPSIFQAQHTQFTHYAGEMFAGAVAASDLGQDLPVNSLHRNPSASFPATLPGSNPVHQVRPLGTDYKIQRSSYYQPGVVFERDWPEPRGGNVDNGSVTTVWSDLNFIKARKFVIIERKHMHVVVLPMHTYKSLGVAKSSVDASEHCIAYTGDILPKPTAAELEKSRKRRDQRMKPRAIRIINNHRGEKLNFMTRINLGKEWPVETNIMVKDFGKVAEDSFDDLMEQYEKVRIDRKGKPVQDRRQAPATSTGRAYP